MACAQGALEIVQLFVSQDDAICRVTLTDSQGLTPLHMAAFNNHLDVVQYLLQQVTSNTAFAALCSQCLTPFESDRLVTFSVLE